MFFVGTYTIFNSIIIKFSIYIYICSSSPTHSTLNKLSKLPPSINFEGVRYDEYPTGFI